MTERSNKTLDLLAQIAPREALDRARALARELERDEYVRDYVSRRALIVAVAGMATTAGFGGGMLLLIGRLSRYLSSLAPWQTAIVLLLAFAVWAGATVSVMYRFLASMQRAALAEKERNTGGA